MPRVKHCLHQRERMIEFAVAAQGLEPAALHKRFLDDFGDEA